MKTNLKKKKNSSNCASNFDTTIDVQVRDGKRINTNVRYGRRKSRPRVLRVLSVWQLARPNSRNSFDITQQRYVETVSDWFTDRPLTTDQRRWKAIYALSRSFLVAIAHKFLRRVPYFPLADVITGNYVHCWRVSDSFNEETPSYRRHFTV